MLVILCLALTAYRYVLIARVIVSFVFLFRPTWEPPQGLKPMLNFVYALTDPPVDFLRRFIPPLQTGAMALDLGFLVWFLVISFLHRALGCSVVSLI